MEISPLCVDVLVVMMVTMLLLLYFFYDYLGERIVQDVLCIWRWGLDLNYNPLSSSGLILKLPTIVFEIRL